MTRPSPPESEIASPAELFKPDRPGASAPGFFRLRRTPRLPRRLASSSPFRAFRAVPPVRRLEKTEAPAPPSPMSDKKKNGNSAASARKFGTAALPTFPALPASCECVPGILVRGVFAPVPYEFVGRGLISPWSASCRRMRALRADAGKKRRSAKTRPPDMPPHGARSAANAIRLCELDAEEMRMRGRPQAKKRPLARRGRSAGFGKSGNFTS